MLVFFSHPAYLTYLSSFLLDTFWQVSLLHEQLCPPSFPKCPLAVISSLFRFYPGQYRFGKSSSFILLIRPYQISGCLWNIFYYNSFCTRKALFLKPLKFNILADRLTISFYPYALITSYSLYHNNKCFCFTIR